jgi:hypothetical protein
MISCYDYWSVLKLCSVIFLLVCEDTHHKADTVVYVLTVYFQWTCGLVFIGTSYYKMLAKSVLRDSRISRKLVFLYVQLFYSIQRAFVCIILQLL